MNPKHAIFVALSALLAGCATTMSMSEAMDSWKGAPLSEVVTRWGPPTSSTPLQDRTIHTWTRAKRVATQRTTDRTVLYGLGEQAKGIDVDMAQVECMRQLVVDPTGIVVGGDWSGNNCPVWGADGLSRTPPQVSDRQ